MKMSQLLGANPNYSYIFSIYSIYSFKLTTKKKKKKKRKKKKKKKKKNNLVSVSSSGSRAHQILQWLLDSFCKPLHWFYGLCTCSVVFGSISPQRPVFLSLSLLYQFLIHRYTENMEMTRERIRSTFDLRYAAISPNWLPLVRAAVACSILERTPDFEPSCTTTSPKYLKLATVPSF